ncbi:hypothetical protein G7Z17_g12766 [Cylindrodendrum hubeiense]|uniref:DUF7708 domain-containing protein n=1 Tax=Cylindrodendrum hubeiense TaxID=595255 RepID=A0A9P5GUV9_9HYPO|nr:hypothetical protein G7Z17_g12766 [Cylindrodendrum hubeiense]
MDFRNSTPAFPGTRPRQTPPTAYEVPEFMVRRLDGQTHPALTATPGSGVVYTGSDQWVAESTETIPIDLEEIYSTCLQAQNSLITKANELCAKRKIPVLDLTAAHSWSEVEESVLDTCKVLESLSSKDKAISPGFTGKLKNRFRSLCSHAGAGTTLVNLVPTDSYCSVLCGGLKIIFKALEETNNYRQEVYSALEELPFILNDNAALLGLNDKDGELHRRVASLYTAIYQLMEVIINWYLKRSLATGTRIFINPSGFSDRLKDSLATVKVSAQRFAARVAIMSAEEQRNLTQQSYTIMYMQEQNSHQMKLGLGQLNSKLILLDRLSDFLDNQASADLERRELGAQQLLIPRIKAPAISVEDILENNLYEPELVPADCEKVFRLRHVPGYDLDEDLVSTVQQHPRFRSWLTLNESSLLFVDTRSENPTCSLEMPIVTAQIYRDIFDFSSEHMAGEHGISTDLLCLVFFCSQHKNFTKDANGSPSELAMSLLLQLVDQYRGFDSHYVTLAFDKLDPTDVESICSVLEALITQLPADVILIVSIDDFKAFTQPPERKRKTIELIERLLDFHRGNEYAATVKFLFGNSTRRGFSDDLFVEDEILRIWSADPTGHG